MRMASILQRTARAITALTTGRSRHRYHSLPVADQEETDDTPIEHRRRTPPQRSTLRRDIVLIIISVLIITSIGYWVSLYYTPTSNGNQSCDDPNDGYICKIDQSHHWGQYAPYFTIPTPISADIPNNCQITFAQILSRHGARDPTADKTIKYSETINYIQQTAGRYPGIYSFLQTYRYHLGADNLTMFGEREMVNSGRKFYKRYQSLAKEAVPFVRSAGQERVVASAQKWAEGFHRARDVDDAATTPDHYPYNIIVIPEGKEFNNTLSHDSCTNFNSTPGNDAQEAWAAIFTPRIIERMHKSMYPVNLDWEQAIHLMDLCPFETVATPLGSISSFCRLFDNEDWLNYDYFQTLGKYYGYGNGNSLGATQGVGFVNELIARMTGKPVDDHTSTNSTLDGSEDTFPIGKTSLYADFSHDNDITGILAALGLYIDTKPPSTTKRQSPEELAGYAASWTVPFAARVYFEKMKCKGESEELVRVLVNDRVMPMQECEADKLGRCKLSKWVDSLDFARKGGNWDECFA